MIRIISAWSANTFAALGHRQFRILFFGTLFATLAYMMMMFTMGIVAEDLSGTNAAVGMIAFAIGLSMFFLSPFGGVIADRLNRKWLIVLGQGTGALLLAVIGLLLVAGLLTLPIFFILSLFLGSTFVFMSPARQAFTADIVGPRLVANAIVLSQMSHIWGQPFSPFVASILVKTPLGPGGTYIVMATLVFIGVATVALMRYRRTKPPVDPSAPLQKRSVGRDMAAGAVYVWRRPQLRFMMLLLVATIVVGSVFRIVLPRYMVEVLDRTPADQGVLLLTYGLGAAAAGLLIAGIAILALGLAGAAGDDRADGRGPLPAGRGDLDGTRDDRAGDHGTGAAGSDDAAAGQHHDEHGAGLLRAGDELHDDGLGPADADRSADRVRR